MRTSPNRVVAQHEGRKIHLILENLNTHKPKNDRWLKRRRWLQQLPAVRRRVGRQP